MRKLLNILYVTVPHAYLSKEGETVLVRVEHETRLRVPVHTLEGIVCVGLVSMSPALMGFCAENRVGVSFLSEHGRFSRASRVPSMETYYSVGNSIAGPTMTQHAAS